MKESKYSYEQIASDYKLWMEYADPSGLDSEQAFNDKSKTEKINFLKSCFGSEESVEEEE
jgi:hypothetical protein